MRRVGVDRREVGETTFLQEVFDDGRKGRAERVNAGCVALCVEERFVANLLASELFVAKDKSNDWDHKETNA